MEVLALLGWLERLERAQRRLKWIGALALLGLGAVVLLGQGQPGSQTVVAQRFVLVDASGTIRAGLGMVDGEATLGLFDASGTTRIQLNAAPDGAVVNLFDASEASRVALQVTAAGPALGLLDGQGTLRLVVGATADVPVLGLFDASGTQRAGLNVQPNGQPGLGLFDAALRQRLALGVSPEGPFLRLLDAQEAPQAVLEAAAGGPDFSLFDQGGRAIFSAP